MTGWTMAVVLAMSLAGPQALPEPVPPTPEAIMAVPPELQARLHDDVLARPASRHERLQRLIGFVSGADGLGMLYRHDATHTVTQAYAAREANCLSFTLLFVALARAAGLDAYPQVIEETLSWHQADGTIYRNNHINAGVRIDGRRYTVDVTSDSVISRQHPAPASDQRMLALYYNNHAVALLAQQRMAPARAYMQAALALDPEYATHWSNAGVLSLRQDDLAEAGRAYDRALALSPEHAGALFNMVGLQARLGDRGQEAAFRRRLEQVQRRDPFHHVLLAIDFEKNGDLRRAVAHYRHAIRLYPDEHRFHFRLAMAYAQLGDVRRASRAMLRAQSRSDGAARDLYQARLQRLQQASRMRNDAP